MATRIEQLASSDTLYYRGDMCMEIAPFDNYYSFTIYKESDDNSIDNSIPLNLTNLGNIYLSFGDIRIPQYDNVENVDTANGEVIFRISKDDAKRILNLSNHTFYISAQITDGKQSGDETVLYSGQWIEFSDGMRSALTDTVNTLTNDIEGLRNQLATTINDYEAKLAERDETIKSLTSALQAQEVTNKALQEQVEALTENDMDYISANILSQYNNSTTTDSNEGVGTTIVPTKNKLDLTQMKSVVEKERVASTLNKAFMSPKNNDAKQTTL